MHPLEKSSPRSSRQQCFFMEVAGVGVGWSRAEIEVSVVFLSEEAAQTGPGEGRIPGVGQGLWGLTPPALLLINLEP